jgi:hypothetical protein
VKRRWMIDRVQTKIKVSLSVICGRILALLFLSSYRTVTSHHSPQDTRIRHGGRRPKREHTKKDLKKAVKDLKKAMKKREHTVIIHSILGMSIDPERDNQTEQRL